METVIPEIGGKFRFPGIRRPTPIVYAIVCHRGDAVECLAKAGVDLRRRVCGMGPIHYAAAVRNREIAQELLERDRKLVNEQTEEGEAPLDFAVSAGDVEMAEMLLAMGADVKHVNADGNTAMHLVMARNSAEIVKALVAFGADMYAVNFAGLKPMDCAMNQNNRDMVELIERISANEEELPTKEEIKMKYEQNNICTFKMESSSENLIKLLFE